ncbi:hypothetical protein ZHAS_00014564 [Anopheles sinensis]|uniref:Uncharacterized protein n=1 Tax=Anopheles sinensis TaxID=74873 RepID=A0A084W8W3_ANOSI|nr:hypothetical protein ZHAS_00014564 [Anopheles sinensis]
MPRNVQRRDGWAEGAKKGAPKRWIISPIVRHTLGSAPVVDQQASEIDDRFDDHKLAWRPVKMELLFRNEATQNETKPRPMLRRELTPDRLLFGTHSGKWVWPIFCLLFI